MKTIISRRYKDKKRWTHYHKLGMDTKYLPDGIETTICGRTTKSFDYDILSITNQVSQVTCPRCIKELEDEKMVWNKS